MIDEIDDVDAKQYHRSSFSTRNSALNTLLRKPIRMQDFIQLCDSVEYWEKYNSILSGPLLSDFNVSLKRISLFISMHDSSLGLHPRQLSGIIIQQIVTLSKYGHDALDIRHP